MKTIGPSVRVYIKSALIFLTLHAFISPPIKAHANTECASHYTTKGFENDGFFRFIKLPPKSVSGGDVLFEFWRGDTKQWDAQGYYGCSNGAVQCFIEIPYSLSGVPQKALEIEMSEFTLTPDLAVIVFSHLPAKLYNAYRWQDGEIGILELDGQKYVPTEPADFFLLPDVFTAQRCIEK